MSKIRDHVLAFHQATNMPILTTPQVPTSDRIRLRAKLVSEESFEFLEALYGKKFDFIKESVKTLIEGLEPQVDLVAVADALGDTDYVVEGSRIEFGIDGDPIADEIQRTNMLKLTGPKREDGKQLKPPGWLPPNITGILLDQGWVPTSKNDLKQLGEQLVEQRTKHNVCAHQKPDPTCVFCMGDVT